MRKLSVSLLAAGAFALAAPAALAADPPAAEQSPIGGAGSHTHHVHTGNGGCVDIDALMFEPEDRGLHRGSNESGPEMGPFHGTCASHMH